MSSTIIVPFRHQFHKIAERIVETFKTVQNGQRWKDVGDFIDTIFKYRFNDTQPLFPIQFFIRSVVSHSRPSKKVWMISTNVPVLYMISSFESKA